MSRKLVDFTKGPNGLTITLLPEGRDELQQKIDDAANDSEAERFEIDPIGADNVFLELIEYQLCNGWETIKPEECGALTDGLILTDDAERNDDGDLIALGRVYWDSQSAVKSAARELYERGTYFLTGRD